MRSEKSKLFILFIIGSLFGILGMYIYQNYNKTENSTGKSGESKSMPSKEISTEKYSSKSSIDELTNEKIVIDYVKANKQLPTYYITKKEAKNKGWIPSEENLCDVLPGSAIGGDHFSNREKTLPKGKYYEADVNYHCGNRNEDRIVFTKNGEVYLSKDHYKTFQKQ